MEIEEDIPEYKINVHKAKTGYVAELYIAQRNDDQSKLKDIELIMIVDRSGSTPKFSKK